MTPHQMTTVRRWADAGAENYMGGVGTAYAATDRQIGKSAESDNAGFIASALQANIKISRGRA